MDAKQIRDEVHRVVRTFAPAAGERLEAGLRLGEGGLAFDSVRLVELLLALEDRFAVPFPAEMLTRPLTIGDLVAHAAAGGR
jgi:acyl carrier protein